MNYETIEKAIGVLQYQTPAHNLVLFTNKTGKKKLNKLIKELGLTDLQVLVKKYRRKHWLATIDTTLMVDIKTERPRLSSFWGQYNYGTGTKPIFDSVLVSA